MPNLESRPAAALLVATGPGAAMKSRRPRVLHPPLGKPLARHPIDLCRRLGIERLAILAGAQAEALRAGLGEEIEILESPDGSARAAASLLESLDGPVLLLPAACPLLTDEAVAGLAARHAETGAAATLLYVPYYYATDNHLVRRAEDGRIEAIALQDEVPDAEVGDWELDAGAFLFDPGKLLAAMQAGAASGDDM